MPKEEFWAQVMADTLSAIQEEADQGDVPTRDQLLNFYYIHFEQLAEHRTFIEVNYGSNIVKLALLEIKGYRSQFQDYCKSLVDRGIDQGIIRNLGLLNTVYTEGLWFQLLFLFNFWMEDESIDKEKTDALIEKTVTSTFDVLEKKEVGSTIDLWKFYFQQFNFKWGR